MNRKIIIFGGTFNPIHNGHLRIARHLGRKFKPAEIIFIPCHTPYHKEHDGLEAPRHRMEMARLAVKGAAGWSASDIDVRRGGRTFSINTVRSLRKRYRSGAELYFVIGVDSLVDLPNWYKIGELSRLCRFITVARPGFRFNLLVKKFPDWLAREVSRLYQPDIRINISSTSVRRNIRAGKSVKSLVPEAVANYIKNHKLYR